MRRVTKCTHPSLQHLSCLLLFNLSFVHVPPLMPLAISQSEEGFSMWLAVFFFFFPSQCGPLWGCSRPVMWRIWSWDARGLRFGRWALMVSPFPACRPISYKKPQTIIKTWWNVVLTNSRMVNKQRTEDLCREDGIKCGGKRVMGKRNGAVMFTLPHSGFVCQHFSTFNIH